MLHLASKIRGAAVNAVDGHIGTVEDFYFQQPEWSIRYVLVHTDTALGGRRVILPSMVVQGAWSHVSIPFALTRDQVRTSPAIDLHSPPSRASEAEVLRYYGQPLYWDDASPGAHVPAVEAGADHLRSTREVTGYHVQATDGEVGHVDDFLVGEQSWKIRYLRIDTSNWLGGKSVIVASDALDWIDTRAGRLKVSVTRDAVKQSPPFAAIESELNSLEMGPSWMIL
jgi:hypothetical protein